VDTAVLIWYFDERITRDLFIPQLRQYQEPRVSQYREIDKVSDLTVNGTSNLFRSDQFIIISIGSAFILAYLYCRPPRIAPVRLRCAARWLAGPSASSVTLVDCRPSRPPPYFPYLCWLGSRHGTLELSLRLC
jgi:hypothetical protein